jgi:hypothetical protein
MRINQRPKIQISKSETLPTQTIFTKIANSQCISLLAQQYIQNTINHKLLNKQALGIVKYVSNRAL